MALNSAAILENSTLFSWELENEFKRGSIRSAWIDLDFFFIFAEKFIDFYFIHRILALKM